MNTAELNKLGLTKEQQQALGRILAMACYGSNLVGATASQSAEMLQASLSVLVSFAKTSYPSGPQAFLSELREVARFCDLPDTFRAYKAGKPL